MFGFSGDLMGITMILGSLMWKLLPSFGISAAVYVLTSYALHTMARNRGIAHSWLSWVPVANLWILGSLSDQYRYVVKNQVRSRRKILMIAAGALTVLMAALLVLVLSALIHVYSAYPQWGQMLLGTAAWTLAALVLAALAGIAWVVTTVFRYLALFDVFTSCDPENRVLYLVLSILFAPVSAVLLFIVRGREAGMPPRKTASYSECI